MLFLDKKEFLKAAQLVNCSQNIKSSLIGPLSSHADLIKRKFPIVNRISTNQIKSTVTQSLHNHLINLCNASESTEYEANFCADKVNSFAEGLHALKILENVTICDSAIQCIDILADHLVHVLTNDSTAQSVGDTLVHVTQVFCFLSYVLSSLVKYGVQIDNSGSAHSKCISRGGTFDDLYPNQAQMKNFVPESIRDFAAPEVTLTEKDIEEFTERVLPHLEHNLVSKMRVHVDSQLSYVKSIKSLTNMKSKLLRLVGA